MGRITDTVKGLLIVNIIFFVGSLTLGNTALNLFALWFPKNDNFQIWQIVTHMFMHGDAGHIFFNMFALYMFGSHLENSIGQKKFLFIYFSAGLGAVGFQLLFTYFQFQPGYQAFIDAGISNEQILDLFRGTSNLNLSNYDINASEKTIENFKNAYHTPMVGASGAIFGVLAAFAVLYPNLPLYIMFIPVPIKAKYLIGGYFLLDLYSGITGQALLGPANVAHWAHIGGAVIGFITMWYWKKNSFNNRRWY
ncbi:rhomboid family intramembrane serine protease [Aquimarina sediminis]|uniref:rhomboid family intramembrane serine protease n=1 Tax=Aquimarina sediminis TaxID=2070536 RepID=UPI000CA080C2|nr:rhomboid family intramembrane serine protease [Aquimarina sediminis]